MKPTTLLIAAAATSLFGAGLAYANEDENNDQTNRNQNGQADQSMTDQGYSQHWFSSTGYGPNDEQADQTRALNKEQLGNGGRDSGRDSDRDMHERGSEDIQGPANGDNGPENSPTPPPPSDQR